MIKKIIEFGFKNRFLVIIAFVGICLGGIMSLSNLPIDAFPDISPNMVQVFAEVNGMAAEEVEQLVTRPVELSMMGMRGVKSIRSLSSFGLSTVKVYFEDNLDIYFTRQLVFERLGSAEEGIPEGIDMSHGIEMGAIASGMGKILTYYIKGDEYDTTQLRTMQEWIIKPALQSVSGVAEVISLGGHIKQFRVDVSPYKLLRYDVTINEVIEAVRENNLNTGAGLLKNYSQEWIIRSLGLVKDVSDIENIVLRSYRGSPVYLKDVADISISQAIRRGIASMDGGKEIVVGGIYKIHGENSFKVISRLNKQMDKINKILPSGVSIVPFYDQGILVKESIKTVRNALGLGLILVCIVLFVFLGKLKNALVVVLSLPFSMLFALIMFRVLHIPGDLISLGGLAIALGMIVDASIIMVEKIHTLNMESSESLSMKDVVIAAAQEVGRPMFFAIAIIIMVFLPIWTLQGVEGKMFRPQAYSVTIAMLGSLIYAMLLAPILYSLTVKNRKPSRDKSDKFMQGLHERYKSMLQFLLPRRKKVAIVTACLLLLGIGVFFNLGKVFVPTLHEGSINVLAHMDPSIALDEAGRVAAKLEEELSTFSEVRQVISEIGYGDVGPHVHHTDYACITLDLYPRHTWKAGGTQEQLVSRMSEKLKGFPGVSISFSQPIQHEVDELVGGAGAQVAAKLFGYDMEVLKQKAAEIEGVLSGIEGVADLRVEQVSGQAHLHIEIDRKEMARQGINISRVQEIIRSSVGGIRAGKVFEGEKSFDIFVRFEESHRNDVEAIKDVLIYGSDGNRVPLSRIAEIRLVEGFRQISHENGQRYISVLSNVRGRDVGGFVEEAQKEIEESVTLPPGYSISWGGQFELQQAANRRLMVVIPITLFIILFLLYSFFKSFKETLLIALNIPLALVGGVFALAITGQDLSIPATIGFIALFGIALQDGLVLISRFKYLHAKGLGLKDGIIEGSLSKLRPVLMTTVTTAFGLIPLIMSTSPGSEIQKPLAIVVVGGIISSTVLTLFVIPTLYGWVKE